MEPGIGYFIFILACIVGLHAYDLSGRRWASIGSSKIRQYLQHKATNKPDFGTAASSSWSSLFTKKRLLDQAKSLRDEAEALASRISGDSTVPAPIEVKVEGSTSQESRSIAQPSTAFIDTFGSASRNLTQYASAPYNHTSVFEATKAAALAARNNKSEDIMDIKQGLDDRSAVFNAVRSEINNSSSVVMESINLLIGSLDSTQTASLLQLIKQRKDKDFKVPIIIKGFMDVLIQSIPKEGSSPVLKELFTYTLLTQLLNADNEDNADITANQFKLLELADENVLQIMSGPMLVVLEDLLREINPEFQGTSILLPSALRPGRFSNATAASVQVLMQDVDYAIQLIDSLAAGKGVSASTMGHVVRTLHNCNVWLQTARPEELTNVSPASLTASSSSNEVSDMLDAIVMNQTASSILAEKLRVYKQELFAKFDAPVLLRGVLTKMLSWAVPVEKDKPLYRDLYICAMYEELNELMKDSEEQQMEKVSELLASKKASTDKAFIARMKAILSVFSSDIASSTSNTGLFASRGDSFEGALRKKAKEDCIARNCQMLAIFEQAYQKKAVMFADGTKSISQILQLNRGLLKQFSSPGAVEGESTSLDVLDDDLIDLMIKSHASSSAAPLPSSPFSALNFTKSNFSFLDVMRQQQQQGDEYLSGGEFLSRAFSSKSRKEGAAINKKGAALLQRAVLKELVDVSEIAYVEGAAIFTCTVPKTKFGQSSEVFLQTITNRLVANNLSSDISFAIIDPLEVEKFVENYVVKFLNLPSQASMVAKARGSGIPVEIVFFPTSWNVSTADIKTDSLNKVLTTIFKGVANAGPVAFMLSLVGEHISYKYADVLAGSTSDTLQANLLDKVDFNALADLLTNSYYPLLASSFIFGFVVRKLTEFQAFKLKLPVFVSTVPSLTLPNLGSLFVLQGLPRDLKETFDLFFLPQVASLVLSLVLLSVGIGLTNAISVETIQSLPVIDASIMNCNNIVESLLKTFLKPGFIDKDFVHVHWLGILGMVSFITSVIQLFPLPGSAGEFIGQAVLGKLGSAFVHATFNFGFLVYVLSHVFHLGPNAAPSTSVFAFDKLMFEIVLWKSFMPKASVELPVRNQFMSSVDDLRKLGYIALIAVLLLSLFPYQSFDIQPQEVYNSISDWLSAFNSKA